MLLQLCFQAALQDTNLSPAFLDGVLRLSIRSVIAYMNFFGDRVHGWHCIAHSILQRTMRILTIGPVDVAPPSELTRESNNEFNCTLINASLGNSCCSVCCRCAVSNHHHRYRVRTASVTHVWFFNLLSVWSHRLSHLMDAGVRCHLLTRFVCTISCIEHDLMPDALRLRVV